jgi:hypothetical protein
MFPYNSCRVNQNTHFIVNSWFLKSCRLCGNVENTVEPDKPQMTIWCMWTACWKPKATNTHSEHVILLASLVQQLLHERASIVHYMYNACLVPSLPQHTGDRPAYYCFMYEAENRGLLSTVSDWFRTDVTLNGVEFGLICHRTFSCVAWFFTSKASNHNGCP